MDFRIITPAIYWSLIILWTFIFVFYLRKLLWENTTDKFFRLLLVILAIDAFRTLFESMYFGAWYTSLTEIIPLPIYEFLAQPKVVFFPKLINLFASFLILFLIIRKWLPEESNRIETLSKLLAEKTKEIETANVILRTEAQSAIENEEKYRKATNNSPFPIMIHAEDGEVILVNKTWTDITGYELNEINTIAKWTEKAYGEKSTTLKKNIDKLYALEKAVDEGEFTITTKSGDQRIWEFSSAPLDFHEDGRRMVISSAVDVSDKKKTANALAESNEYNRALFEQITIGLALTSMDGKLVDVNAAFATIIGYSIEEMLQLSYWDITPKKYADDEKRQLESIRKNKRYGPYEKEYIHKDGHLVAVRLQGKLLTREGVDYIWSSIEDITEIKQAHLSILESEKQFRSLIEQSGDAMFLSDFDGNIIYVNKKACESLGYERSELLKLKVTDIDDSYTSISDQKKLWDKFIPGETQTLETQHKRKNGELISVELTFGLYEYSNKKAILGFARDITQRKAADEILQKSKMELLEAQRIGRLGSWYLNLDTNEVIWTEELYKMYNFDPTLPPPSYTEHQKIVTAESWDKLNKAIIKTSETGIPYELELETIRKDGSNGWLLASGEQVKDANGKVIGLRGVAQDIAERKQAEYKINQLNEDLENKVHTRTVELENKGKDLIDSQNALLNIVEDLNEKSEQLEENAAALESVNQELESFSYSVSHDLRAPLRGIDGFSLALLEDYGDVLDEQGKGYLNRVRNGSQKMALLIDEMLSLSRLGRMSLKPTTVNLSEMAQALSNDLSEHAPQRLAEFIIAKNISCTADPTLIRAVLQNLLENAWKFTSKIEKGEIEFGVLDNEGKRMYFVKDNGAGFNMAYKNKLFTPFQRLHQESEFPGTGIGLTTVQRIIHRHNGTIWAESKVNAGATFYFTLQL